MIIFGTRSISTNRERGEFYCPKCAGRRAYRQRRARSFFHIYWIPLIPVSGGQEYLRCEACKGDFRLDVLQHDPDKQAAAFTDAFSEAVRCVVVAMIAADGEIDPAEIDRARDVVLQVTRAELSTEEVQRRVSEAMDGRVPVDAALRRIAPSINEHGKELLVRIAVDIAAADGDFSEGEIELVERVAECLGMSKAHLRGILLASPAHESREAEEGSDRSY